MDDLIALRRYHRLKDPEAFSYLVYSYQRMVYAICRRLLANSADAEDATQETFLKLAKNAGRVRANLAGWLHSCAANTAKDLARKEATRQRHQRAAATEPGRENIGESTELIAHLDEALSRLDADDRDLICGRYLAGRTQSELARARGVSQSLISRRIRRAVERLRRQMNQAGCAVVPAALVPVLQTQAANASVPASVQTSLIKIGMSGTGPVPIHTAGVLLMAVSSKTKLVAAGIIAALLLVGVTAVVKLRESDDPSAQLARTLAGQGYELDEDENLRFLAPPYPVERNTLLSEYASSNNLNDWKVVFEWHNGAGDEGGLRFKASSLTPPSLVGYRIYKDWIAENVLGLEWYGLGDHRVVSLPVGDWILRSELTFDEKRKAYEGVLSIVSGRNIELERSRVSMDCVVWRGHPTAPTPNGPDGGIHVLLTGVGSALDPAEVSRASGHSTSPHSWFARVRMPFIDETQGSSLPLVMYSIMPDIDQIKPGSPRARSTVNRVLRNLEEQLEGGTYVIESREFEVWTPVAR